MFGYWNRQYLVKLIHCCAFATAIIISVSLYCRSYASPYLRLYKDLKNQTKNVVVPTQKTNSKINISNITAQPGDAVKLNIELNSTFIVPDGDRTQPRFLMIRGLPEGFALSAGFQTSNAWAVATNDIADLSLRSPPDYIGGFEFDVTVHTSDGSVLLESTARADFTSETVAPEPMSKAAGDSANDSQPAGNAAQITAARPTTVTSTVEPSKQPGMSPEVQERLLDKARGLIERGLIAAAQLLLKKLAEDSNAQAAYEMARTYDPGVLRNQNVVGFQPDIQQARKWYQKAADMGLEPANDRLTAISQGR